MSQIFGASGLQFGVPPLVSSSLQISDIEIKNASQTTEVTGRDGEVLGIAQYGTNKYEINGTYTYQGTDMSLTSTLDVSAINPSLTGSMIFTEVSAKVSNSAFRTGTFTGISVRGINFASGSVVPS
jgi:hypothetical protein